MQKTKNTSKRRLVWFTGLAIIIVFIKIISLHRYWIEDVYATKFYAGVSIFLRILFGWLPFSIGDIFYLVVIIWFIWKVWQISALLFRRRLSKKWFLRTGYKLLMIAMLVYTGFNILWGMNYNRLGITKQLDLQVKEIDSGDLKVVEMLLLQKLNQSKQVLINQNITYPSNRDLFTRASTCYQQTNNKYPFLNYRYRSVKSSMFGWWGNYFGFTGYYNPFSGEAQLNTSMPKFILPYTTVHEMAHQLGYAKEEEANFVGYLAGTTSTDTLFHYSTYLDLFVYANRKLFYMDSVSARAAIVQLSPAVKADLKELKEFLRKHQSPFEPAIRWAYGSFLRANEQPKGITSYDEVIADLIAFYKKYGKI